MTEDAIGSTRLIVPHYAAKMELILEPSGHARDRADWRDEFK